MSALPRLYLDTNATAPLKEAVQKALHTLVDEGLANPSSIHRHGQKAKKHIAKAREDIALSLGGIDPEQLLFTSSGTEANQTVIRSQLEAFFNSGMPVHWITSPVEHDSVIQMVDWVKQKGGEVSLCEIDKNGIPLPSSLQSLIRPETRLVSLMWVNNETGAVSPLEEYATICAGKAVPLHIDAAQAWGKLSIHLPSLAVQFATFSAHKIGALSGVGVVAIRPGSKVFPFIYGKQEKGRRGGTENLMGIVALGEASRTLNLANYAELAEQRNRLESIIQKNLSGVTVNAQDANRVAGVSNLSFDGVDGESLVMALDLKGLSLSAGSACSSGVIEPSHVLTAMGRSPKLALASLRMSWVNPLSEEEITRITTEISDTIRSFRERNSGLSFNTHART